MVPRIAKRGHSFKGASLYYLHDKQAKTTERVDWVFTHNLPTNDPQKAFGWMTHTAMNANTLKRLSGTSHRGRKSQAGPVYSFSLSWHPKQSPTKDEMYEAGKEALIRLKLGDHEAVFISHNDEKHPHVHVVCNLIHPETGKTASCSYDRLTLSKWAEEYEQNDGEILCPKRVENNEKRRLEAKPDRQLALVKHKEEKMQQTKRIQELYSQSKTSLAFQSGLADMGFTLAKGDRRGYVLVDESGKITSLSRQLKGVRAKELRERLSGISELPDAASISHERVLQPKTNKEEDIKIQEPKKEFNARVGKRYKPSPEVLKKFEAAKSKPEPLKQYDDSHLKKIDRMAELEAKRSIQRSQLEAQQKQSYRKNEILKKIKTLKSAQEKESVLSKISGISRKREDELHRHQKTLENLKARIQEQNETLENRFKQQKDDTLADLKQHSESYIRRIREDQNHTQSFDRSP